MPQNAIQICNNALLKLGEQPLASLQDKCPVAELVRMRYTGVRDQVLRAHPWAFAKTALSLAALADTPSPLSYTYVYQLPPDLGRVVELSNSTGDQVDFIRLGDKIHTNSSTLRLTYVKVYAQLEETYAFPDDFANCVAELLAAELCMKVTQSAELKAHLLQQYYTNLSFARNNNTTDTYNEVVESTWIQAHEG